MKIEEILRKVIKIRLFEKKLLELYDQGLLNGTTHTCIGQEIIPVFFSQFLNNEDQIFSNHRGHGHFLAFHENKFKELLLEIMGKSGALLSGKGGSQHIHYKNVRCEYFGQTLPLAIVQRILFVLKIYLHKNYK